MRVQGSGFRHQLNSPGEQQVSPFLRVEDLDVYNRLCDLHIEVCQLTRSWPAEERYELGGQARKASNSAPANLAEKHRDRHIRNKIEGVNRARTEATETIHHLYVAHRKGCISRQEYEGFRSRYRECIRMLNGMERTLEQQLPAREHRWPEPRTLNPYGSASA